MIKTKTVRWGIVGAGRIAEQFSRDMSYTANAKLCAIASRRQQDAENFAQKHAIEKSYGSYDDLFKDPDIDAIYIATPHTCHLQQSKDALAAGKAVLCEKPLTINSQECKELLDFASQADHFLMEGLWTYFLPAIQKAKQWLDEGRIGTLKHINADFGYPILPFDANSRVYNKELAGGCMLDMGIYPISMAWYFMKQDPLSMQVLAKHAPNSVEDDVSMLFDYGAVTATLATSFRCKLQNWCYLIGDEGSIAIPDFWRASECHLYQRDTLIETFDDGRKGEGFEFEIGSVSADILAGKKQSSVVPLSTSLTFQQHIDEVKTHFKHPR
ncbi:MAG: putative dehydrogenase [Oceanicoccus sp.]|jgi:predicted dehydrogenase